jgi:hypothetical protein
LDEAGVVRDELKALAGDIEDDHTDEISCDNEVIWDDGSCHGGKA